MTLRGNLLRGVAIIVRPGPELGADRYHRQLTGAGFRLLRTYA
jgi:hypothetical protein